MCQSQQNCGFRGRAVPADKSRMGAVSDLFAGGAAMSRMKLRARRLPPGEFALWRNG